MKLLEEINAFPPALRHTLEADYGIETAEAFFAHAEQDPEGIVRALAVDAGEVQRLARLVEGYLPRDFVARCRQPVKAHSRGALF